MLSDRILAELPAWVPTTLGDGVFERLLGEGLGPGKWTYYEEGRGSTCGVFVAAILEICGAPRVMINRGKVHVPGAPISRLIAGAKALKVWREDVAGMNPGDVYVVAVPPDFTDTHVGFFISHLPGGWIRTADAGQTARNGAQATRFCKRRTTAGAISYPGGEGFRPFHGRVDLRAIPDEAKSNGTAAAIAAIAAAVAITA